MPNLFRRLMNHETYILILGIFLGAGLGALTSGAVLLVSYVGTMQPLTDLLIWVGAGLILLGLIGVVHWNMTE